MNAQQALEITNTNLRGPVTEPYLEAVYRKVEEAAKDGRRSITNPFAGIRMMHPSPEAKKQIWQTLRNEGYEVTHHPDPDPGHPCSGPYDEVSW